MADAFQHQKLREGVLAWNAWRHDNPEVTPQLQDLELSLCERQLPPKTGLWAINLNRACLDGANLRHARLIEARFKSASLVGADLSNAHLNSANFTNANLTRAILDDADLAGAVLDAAILKGAGLRRARNLTQEQIDRAIGDNDTVLPPNLEVPEVWNRSTATQGEDGTDAIRAFLPDDPGDLYSALRVSREATEEDIRQAYHKVVLVLHPDRCRGDRGTEDALKSLTVAGRILRDPAKRKAYDEGLIAADGKFTDLGLRREKRRQLHRAVGYYFGGTVAAGLSLVAAFVLLKSPDLSGRDVARLSGAPDRSSAEAPAEAPEAEQAKMASAAPHGAGKGDVGVRESPPDAGGVAPNVEVPQDKTGPESSPDTVQRLTALSQPALPEIPSTLPAEIGSNKPDLLRPESAAFSPPQVQRARESSGDAPAEKQDAADGTSRGAAERHNTAKEAREAGMSVASTEARTDGRDAPDAPSVKAYRDRGQVRITWERLAKLKEAKAKALETAQAKPSQQARPKAARPRTSEHAAARGWPSADDPFVDANGRVR